MTKEEKARAYEEALDRMKYVVIVPKNEKALQALKETIFPELAESEGERIRKAIEGIIRVYGKTHGEWISGYDMDTLVAHLRDAFAYLEKQKEQSSADCITGQSMDNLLCFKQYAEHLAKDYGVGFTRNIDWHNFCAGIMLYFEKIYKAEWSEEDEKIREELYEYFRQLQLMSDREFSPSLSIDKILSWLKPIRQQPKQEWSEEDERILKGIIGKIDHDQTYGVSKAEMLSFLESLRPSWKPSGEQLDAFRSYIKDFHEKAEAAVGGWNNFDVMIRLYEQLKKLI